MKVSRWNAGETFSVYFYEKLKLITKLRLNEEGSLWYIVDGIGNYVLPAQMIATRHYKLADLLETMNLLTENQMHRGSRRNTPDTPPVNNVNRWSTGPPAQVRMSRSSAVRCFNCNEMGHSLLSVQD